MARYINADALIKVLDAKADMAMGTPKKVFLSVSGMVNYLPPADVAPRAEVAREIFKEIRNILNKHYYACYQNEDGDECDAVISYLSYVAVDFDRLEQKYTKAETEPPKTD